MQNLDLAPIDLALPIGYFSASLAFSPDGKRIASQPFDISTWNRSVQIWNMDIQDIKFKACQQAGRNFTSAEWNQYFSGEPYPVRQEDATCPQWRLEPVPTTTPVATAASLPTSAASISIPSTIATTTLYLPSMPSIATATPLPASSTSTGIATAPHLTSTPNCLDTANADPLFILQCFATQTALAKPSSTSTPITTSTP
jgi:hypothetical protein